MDNHDDPPAAKNVRLISRLWAGLLSLVYPGLGQAFRGAYGRGVWFAAANLIALLFLTQSVYGWLLIRSGLPFSALWVVSGLSVLTVMCWSAIDALRFRQNHAKRLRRWWARYLVYAGFFAVLGSREFILDFPHWEPFSIPSASMEPNALVGDYILTIKGYYRDHFPQRGELVVFALPSDTSIDFFKRIVGLPGDRIQMKNGILYVNDLAVRREIAGSYVFRGEVKPEIFHEYRENLTDGVSYLIALEGDDKPLENTAPFVVPTGRYFMLGDNRDYSADSRDPDSGVGFVPLQNLKAYPAFIYFSTNGSARWWEFWKWPQSIRWDRIGQRLN